MHQFKMRADIRERILARRGRLHIHEHLIAANTALVVVDMQNAFVDPAKPSAVPEAKSIVSNINRLATALRTHGGTVAWVYTTFTESTLTDWNAFFGAVYSAQFSRAVVSNLYDGACRSVRIALVHSCQMPAILKSMMAHDANAALTDADHNASMNAIAQTFGDVMSTNEVIALLSTKSRID